MTRGENQGRNFLHRLQAMVARLYQEDAIQMRESSTPSGIVLRMRHCNGDFEPWKDSDEAGDLVITSFDSGKQVTFENKKVRHVKVIYKNLGAKKLSVLIEDTQDGKVSSYPFEFDRVD